MDSEFEHVELVSVAKVREDIAHYLNSAGDMGVRIGITRHNRPVAAIVPFTDLAFLEAMDETAMESAEAEHEEVSADMDYSPTETIFSGSVAQLVPYLTGQIAARIADAKIVEEPGVFSAVQGIIAQTIHDNFDNTVLPNPPDAIMGTKVGFEEDRGYSTFEGPLVAAGV